MLIFFPFSTKNQLKWDYSPYVAVLQFYVIHKAVALIY